MRERLRTPLAVGVAVAMLCAVALTAAHHTPKPAVNSAAAVRAAEHDGQVERALAGVRAYTVKVTGLDSRLERVSFWADGRIIAEAAVQPGAHVLQGVDDRSMRVPYGDWIAYRPALLVALSALFLAMTLVRPWWRVRNLDALATASLTVSVVLFQHRYLDASIIAAAGALSYALVRCAWRGLAGERAPVPSTPLLSLLGRRRGAAGRVRWLRLCLLVLAVIYAMVVVSSPDAVDVTYAVMEGATALLHGVLPYGHLPPGIIHGDTYPILSYALYVPVAWFEPVRSAWSSVDGALAIAALAVLLTAGAAFRAVAPRRPARSPEVEEAGLRAALAVLAFPPLLITASTGTSDVVLGAMLVLAVLLWRRPAAGAALLSLAGWFKLAPFALLPVLLAPLRGRRLLAPLVSIAAVAVPVLALLVVLGGAHGPGEMLHAIAYQFTRGSLQSVWSVLGIERLQPVAQACGARPHRCHRRPAAPPPAAGARPRADGGDRGRDPDRPAARRRLLGLPVCRVVRAAAVRRAAGAGRCPGVRAGARASRVGEPGRGRAARLSRRSRPGRSCAPAKGVQSAGRRSTSRGGRPITPPESVWVIPLTKLS